MDPIVLIFWLAVLLFSVIIHEVAHGATALALGDSTARDLGRLTLNPIKHIDPFGSIIVPAVLAAFTVVSGTGVIFGWAKPVPYNPIYFRKPRRDSALVGLAGPLSNIALAAVFAIVLRVLAAQDLIGTANGAIAALFFLVVFTNLLLAVFNLMPVPPLDGSKLLFAFLADRYQGIVFFLERYGLLLFLFFIFFLAGIVFPLAIKAALFFVGPNALPPSLL